MYLDSLQRRIAGMHSLWLEATSTMGAEHVNHFERSGVLPAAFSLNHMTRIEDQVVSVLFNGRSPIWNEGGWLDKTGVNIDDHGKELTVAEMEQLRIGDYDAYCAYQKEVFEQTESWLASIDDAKLEEVMFGGIVPPVFQKAYVARVVGDGPIRVLDGIECWIFQHGIRHMGELEHARALVGLGGMTS
jgi:hypothetical protein